MKVTTTIKVSNGDRSAEVRVVAEHANPYGQSPVVGGLEKALDGARKIVAELGK